MTGFLSKKIQNIRGVATPECPWVGDPQSNDRSDVHAMPSRSPARRTWIFKVSGATKGVEVTPVRADHDNSVGSQPALQIQKVTNFDSDQSHRSCR